MRCVKMIVVVLLTNLTACSGVQFDPDFYVGDSGRMQIVPALGPTVFCEEKKFDEYACLHKTKIIELKKLLSRVSINSALRSPSDEGKGIVRPAPIEEAREKAIKELDFLLARMR